MENENDYERYTGVLDRLGCLIAAGETEEAVTLVGKNIEDGTINVADVVSVVCNVPPKPKKKRKRTK